MEEPSKKKSKYGRKHLKEDEKRVHISFLRFNKSEWDELHIIREKTGIKEMAVFLRELTIRTSTELQFMPEVNKKTKIEIRRIGVNLNQIARRVNGQKENIELDKLLNEIVLIKEQLIELMAAIPSIKLKS